MKQQEQNELTPAEATQALGVNTRSYIYELLAAGRLQGRRILGRWLISRAEISRYRREHPARLRNHGD